MASITVTLANGGLSFDPDSLEVDAAEEVEWEWADDTPLGCQFCGISGLPTPPFTVGSTFPTRKLKVQDDDSVSGTWSYTISYTTTGSCANSMDSDPQIYNKPT